jgi:hypothetical protein
MTEDQKRRIFQKVKSMTLAQYWDWLERVNTQAYLIGQDHMTEAMGCHPRISKKMVQEVKAKADQIREEWDGIVMTSE